MSSVIIWMYSEAIAGLSRIVTIRPSPTLAKSLAALTHAITPAFDHTLARIRDEMLATDDDILALHNYIRAAEIRGIAKAVEACFVHHKLPSASAADAVLSARGLFAHAERLFTPGSKEAISADCDDGFRAAAIARLDWVPPYRTLDGSAPDKEHTCLPLFITYLQFVLCATPMEQWADALHPHADDDLARLSPLRLALNWARENHGSRPETVDVVLLVTIGRQVQRVVEEEQSKAAEEARAAGAGFATTVRDQGLGSAIVRLYHRLQDTAASPPSRSRTHGYAALAEPHASQAIQVAAQMLLETGEQYAQLLSRPDVPLDEVSDILDRLRTWTASIVSKAEPLVPPTVIDAIPGLKKQGL